MPDSVHAITVTVNGTPHELTVLGRQLLVHALRDTLGLKGTHIGCDSGTCGACTVIWDGKVAKSCMLLAVQADGSELRTVEGLAGPDGELDELQQAFTARHALQCGYCTPGMLMSATHLLETEAEPPSPERIRWALKGNVCRCTGYQNIVEAVADAAGTGDAT
jgi:aerobic-type carbon monoxide dehydrogenase small subunit (CoxS/CutS family)